MRADIHPTYHSEATVSCACGYSWKTGSTQAEIRIDICSECHPFYTGEQRIVDTAGQVERFMGRLKQYGAYAEEQEKRDQQAQEKSAQSFLNQQILALDLSDRIFQILTDANYATVGNIVDKVENDPESLLELNGFGPKALEQLVEKIDTARETFEASKN
ncbi:MAG: 50S ribosomal protein L31 [Chloroflexota bacterium]